MFLSISTLTAESSAADIASAGQQALQSVRVAAAAFDGLAADLESDFAGSPISPRPISSPRLPGSSAIISSAAF